MNLSSAFQKAEKAPQQAQPAMQGLWFWLQHFNGQQNLLNNDPIVIDEGSLTVGKGWGPAPGKEQAPGAKVQTPVPPDYQTTPVTGDTWNKYLDHLLDREGYRTRVYLDSEGKPTVGVGHLVRPEDHLQVGDRISDGQVRGMLEKDAAKAYRAAVAQANELGINDSSFVIALGSVNYQLGTGWRKKFPQTWQHLKDGDYEQAINGINHSLWARQTPVRTKDFTAAIRNAAAAADVSEQFASNASGKTHEPLPGGASGNGPQPALPGRSLT